MSVSGFYQPMRQLPAFYGHFCSWWAFRLGIVVAGENPKRAWNANYTLWAPQFVAFRPDGIILSPLQHLCWKGLDSIIGFPLHPTIILRPLGHLRGFARPVYLWQGLGIVKWAFRLVCCTQSRTMIEIFIHTLVAVWSVIFCMVSVRQASCCSTRQGLRKYELQYLFLPRIAW